MDDQHVVIVLTLTHRHNLVRGHATGSSNSECKKKTRVRVRFGIIG